MLDFKQPGQCIYFGSTDHGPWFIHVHSDESFDAICRSFILVHQERDLLLDLCGLSEPHFLWRARQRQCEVFELQTDALLPRQLLRQEVHVYVQAHGY